MDKERLKIKHDQQMIDAWTVIFNKETQRILHKKDIAWLREELLDTRRRTPATKLRYRKFLKRVCSLNDKQLEQWLTKFLEELTKGYQLGTEYAPDV